jgi:hypothetical protein
VALLDTHLIPDLPRLQELQFFSPAGSNEFCWELIAGDLIPELPAAPPTHSLVLVLDPCRLILDFHTLKISFSRLSVGPVISSKVADSQTISAGAADSSGNHFAVSPKLLGHPSKDCAAEARRVCRCSGGTGSTEELGVEAW